MIDEKLRFLISRLTGVQRNDPVVETADRFNDTGAALEMILYRLERIEERLNEYDGL